MLKSNSRYFGSDKKYEMQKYYRSRVFHVLKEGGGGGAKSCLQNLLPNDGSWTLGLQQEEPRHQRRTKF